MKNSLHISTGCAAAVAWLLVACSDPAPAKTSATEKLSPAQLKTIVDTEENLFFLDVRSSEEIAKLGTLPGYVNIPIDQLELRLAEIPKNKPIVTA